MDSEGFHQASKRRICLDSVEDVETPVKVFTDVVLVFPEVNVDSAKDDTGCYVSTGVQRKYTLILQREKLSHLWNPDKKSQVRRW